MRILETNVELLISGEVLIMKMQKEKNRCGSALIATLVVFLMLIAAAGGVFCSDPLVRGRRTEPFAYGAAERVHAQLCACYEKSDPAGIVLCGQILERHLGLHCDRLRAGQCQPAGFGLCPLPVVRDSDHRWHQYSGRKIL